MSNQATCQNGVKTQTRIVQGHKSDLPPGAVLVSQAEVGQMVETAIKKWAPKTDIWSLVYGAGIISGTTTATSVYIMNIYRTAFFLRNKSPVATFISTVIMPCGASAVLNNVFVVTPMLHGYNSCAGCAETKAAMIQLATGWSQPIILSALVCTMFAERHGTVGIPWVLDKPSKLLGLVTNPLRKHSRKLILLCGLNVLVAALLSHQQAHHAEKVRHHILQQKAFFTPQLKYNAGTG